VSFKDHVRDVDAAVARNDEVAAGDHLFLALHRLPPGPVVDLAAQLVAELLPQFHGGPGWFEGFEEELHRVGEVARDPDPEHFVTRDGWQMPVRQVLPPAEVHFRAATSGLLDAVDGRSFPEMITSAATGSILDALAARNMLAWRAADPEGYGVLGERWRAHVLGLPQGLDAGMPPVDPPEVLAERSQGWRELVARLQDLAPQAVPEVNDEPGAARARERWRKHGGVLYPPAGSSSTKR
jgi:hypothetical protein